MNENQGIEGLSSHVINYNSSDIISTKQNNKRQNLIRQVDMTRSKTCNKYTTLNWNYVWGVFRSTCLPSVWRDHKTKSDYVLTLDVHLDLIRCVGDMRLTPKNTQTFNGCYYVWNHMYKYQPDNYYRNWYSHQYQIRLSFGWLLVFRDTKFIINLVIPV